jgi:hypothetical protein
MNKLIKKGGAGPDGAPGPAAPVPQQQPARGHRVDRTTGLPLAPEEYEALAVLWQDPVVRAFYERRAEFSLNDSAR